LHADHNERLFLLHNHTSSSPYNNIAFVWFFVFVHCHYGETKIESADIFSVVFCHCDILWIHHMWCSNDILDHWMWTQCRMASWFSIGDYVNWENRLCVWHNNLWHLYMFMLSTSQIMCKFYCLENVQYKRNFVSSVVFLHCVPTLTILLVFFHNFFKCRPILIIFSHVDSARNLQKKHLCSNPFVRNLKCHFYHFTTTAVTKTHIEINWFLLNLIYIMITVIHFWLNSNCLSCTKSVVSSLSSSKTMCQNNECAQPPCQCLPFLNSDCRLTVYICTSLVKITCELMSLSWIYDMYCKDIQNSFARYVIETYRPTDNG